MQIDLSGDELILALVSMVRAVDPSMLRQGAEGFEIDFQALDAKKEFSADKDLLLKLRATLERPAPAVNYALELDTAEGRQLSQALERLESLQSWPPDVLEMSRNLRARLASIEE